MAFDSVWLNGQITTIRIGGGAYGEVPDGAVAVTGGKIEWVGPSRSYPRVIRALKPRYTMPGAPG